MDRKRDRKDVIEKAVRKKAYLCVGAGLILWGLFVCCGMAFWTERDRELRLRQQRELSAIYPQLEEYLIENEEYYARQWKRDFQKTTVCVYFAGVLVFWTACEFFLHDRKVQQTNTRRTLERLSDEFGQLLRGEADITMKRIGYGEVFTEEWEVYLEKLKQLGRYFADMRQRLEQEENETKALITDLSHQLKTPLSALRLSHELLLTEHLSEAEFQEFLEKEGQEITALESLMEELVKLSRLESHMIQIKPEPIELKYILTEAINKVFFKAHEKNIAIELKEEGLKSDGEQAQLSSGGTIFCDPVWTAEAFANVLENAVKYSEENTMITVTMGILINFVYVDIEDEGMGISPQELNSIYKRFYRGREAQKRVKDGVGVGLYLTRKVLEEQGGNIVAKRRRRGSCFRITLPCENRNLTKLS